MVETEFSVSSDGKLLSVNGHQIPFEGDIGSADKTDDQKRPTLIEGSMDWIR